MTRGKITFKVSAAELARLAAIAAAKKKKQLEEGVSSDDGAPIDKHPELDEEIVLRTHLCVDTGYTRIMMCGPLEQSVLHSGNWCDIPNKINF